jgi:hypothetical protein
MSSVRMTPVKESSSIRNRLAVIWPIAISGPLSRPDRVDGLTLASPCRQTGAGMNPTNTGTVALRETIVSAVQAQRAHYSDRSTRRARKRILLTRW